MIRKLSRSLLVALASGLTPILACNAVLGNEAGILDPNFGTDAADEPSVGLDWTPGRANAWPRTVAAPTPATSSSKKGSSTGGSRTSRGSNLALESGSLGEGASMQPCGFFTGRGVGPVTRSALSASRVTAARRSGR